MFWQSIDPIAAIRVLAMHFHVHAKDTQIYGRNLPTTACSTPSSIPTRRIAPGSSAPAVTDTVLSGEEFISTLRMYGYDYCCRSSTKIHLVARGRAAQGDHFPGCIVIKEQPTAWWFK